MKKSFLLAFAATALFAAPAFARGDTMTVGLAIDAKNLAPQNSVDTYSFCHANQMYETSTPSTAREGSA